MQCTISSTFQVAGLHCWPNAHERRAYLRNLHRHQFVVSVQAEVHHNERDIEFHDLMEEAEKIFRTFGSEYHPDSLLVNFGSQSCETLAQRLIKQLQERNIPIVSVSVSEDGEAISCMRV